MILQHIDFGPVAGASGVEGFFGGKKSEYWFHKPWKWLGLLNLEGMTFTAKTSTLEARLEPENSKGNMRLKADGITPAHWFPDCVKARFWSGDMLNAVGLSGLGLMTLLTDGRWQERDKPFFISIAAVGKTRGERLGEISAMIRMLVMFKTSFNTPFGLQINFSCPNAGHKLNGADNELVSEVAEVLDIALELGVPLVPKFAVTLSLNAMQNVARLRACDALHFSNTIPFGQLPERINWKGIFGSEQSPLTKYGGGGLSGPKLFPLVLERVKELREAGIEKPILAGGGITRQQDVYQLFQAGNKQVGDFAIALGAVVPFRPWRVAGIIRRAHELCKR